MTAISIRVRIGLNGVHSNLALKLAIAEKSDELERVWMALLAKMGVKMTMKKWSLATHNIAHFG